MEKFYIRFFIILLIVTLTNSCVIKPWSRYDYISDHDKNINEWIDLNELKNTNHYIDGAFIEVFFRAHNETIYSGSPPYILFINAVTKNTEHTKLIIHSITIESNFSKLYPVSLISTDKIGKELTELHYPTIILFKTLDYTGDAYKNRYVASVRSSDNLYFEPTKKKM